MNYSKLTQMKIFSLAVIITGALSCSKSKDNVDDMKREATVNIIAVRSTTGPLSNNWEVLITMNKAVSQMEGNAIVQHDLWDLGQFKKTYIDTFDFKITNSNSISFRTDRNANYQGPEIKNIKVNKFTQNVGNYDIMFKQ